MNTQDVRKTLPTVHTKEQVKYISMNQVVGDIYSYANIDKGVPVQTNQCCRQAGVISTPNTEYSKLYSCKSVKWRNLEL